MKLKYKTYVRILFLMISTILFSYFIYSFYFIQNYPISITNRISFDAKIGFIKQNIDLTMIDTIIVGSSIGLNNVQGEALEKYSKEAKGVLNLSVYEATPPQIKQVLELIPLFPNLKRVIYSAQFSDFAYAGKLKDYNSKFIIDYISNNLSIKESVKFYFKSCQDIFFCIKRQWNWNREYQQSNHFTYLGFDKSGSVPLEIYGKDIIQSRWKNPHRDRQSIYAFRALDKITEDLKKKDINFIFVMQPYRQPLVKKYNHLKPTMQKFKQKVEVILSKNTGVFLDLHNMMNLQDEYFADRSHLNSKGSLISSKAIAEFLDKESKK